VCGVSLCVNAVFIASGWAWHYEPVLRRWSERLDFGDGWACLWHGVTFQHRQVLPWAVKGEGMSVNEAVYTQGRTGDDDGVKWIWSQWGGVALPPKEMR
jgi:hypothetical protein